jgi:hypothetical protein
LGVAKLEISKGITGFIIPGVYMAGV